MPMRRIPVNEAEAGMVTVQDIVDINGRILIHAGSRLSPVAIRRLPLWEITEIFIESTEEEPETSEITVSSMTKSLTNSEPTADVELIAEIKAKLDQRFANIDETNFYKGYRKILLKHLVNNNNNGIGILPGSY